MVIDSIEDYLYLPFELFSLLSTNEIVVFYKDKKPSSPENFDDYVTYHYDRNKIPLYTRGSSVLMNHGYIVDGENRTLTKISLNNKQIGLLSKFVKDGIDNEQRKQGTRALPRAVQEELF